MLSVYANILPDVPYVPLLYPNLGIQERDTILFLNNAFKSLTEPFVELVETPEEADYILLPHNYPSLKGKGAYIAEQAALADRVGKKLIIFWHGDSADQVPFPNAIVIRTNQYRHTLRNNEIMMPAYGEDLLEGELAIRAKGSGKPVIGFCGWAGYKNLQNRIATMLKNSFIELQQMLGHRHLGSRIKGITFRMKALSHLQHSSEIEPNFIIRNSYSGHSSTIKMDPEQARKEYIDNLINSDYALVVKGDGNYSYRFYEALSLGRIPVLLDTDCVLPLEDVIDYSEFVIRIPYWDVYHIDHYVSEHFKEVTPKKFESMQTKAREAYEKYLRVDRYLKHIVHSLEKDLRPET